MRSGKTAIWKVNRELIAPMQISLSAQGQFHSETNRKCLSWCRSEQPVVRLHKQSSPEPRSVLLQHMRSPSVSCLDVETSPSTADSTPDTLTPSTPTKSHRRSASCGNNPPNSVQGSGPDMRIIRIGMDLHDGNMYRSILVGARGGFGSDWQQQPGHAALISQDPVMIVIRVGPWG